MLSKMKFLVVVVAVAVCCLMTSTAQAETELTMYYPVAVGGPLTKVVDSMVVDFMKENPDIKVNAIYAGNYNDARIKALAALKGDLTATDPAAKRGLMVTPRSMSMASRSRSSLPSSSCSSSGSGISGGGTTSRTSSAECLRNSLRMNRTISRPTSSIACVTSRPNSRPWGDVKRIVSSRRRYIPLVAKKLSKSTERVGFHAGLSSKDSAELLELEDLLPIEALSAFHLVALRQVYESQQRRDGSNSKKEFGSETVPGSPSKARNRNASRFRILRSSGATTKRKSQAAYVDLGNDGIPMESVVAAAKIVNADTVADLVGWEHVLRERGADLSVGEGQLVTFARAMAHDPEVVILDEATASIDTMTEQLIQDALAKIFERKTVIVVAHRLSTVERADRIVVMDRGLIVEQGTHAELLAAGGAYARLVKAGEELLVA